MPVTFDKCTCSVTESSLKGYKLCVYFLEAASALITVLNGKKNEKENGIRMIDRPVDKRDNQIKFDF